MNIIDLAKQSKWEDVSRAISYHYPTDKNDYSGLFTKLRETRKRRHKDAKEKIVVRMHPVSDWTEEPYYSIATNKFSLSLRKWAEVANIDIAPATLKYYTPEDILAHFIWEITFYGNEKDMEEARRKIYSRIDECKTAV